MNRVFVLCLIMMLAVCTGRAQASAPSATAGSELNSFSVVYFNGVLKPSKPVSIKVPQIYGLALRPTEAKLKVSPGGTVFLACQLENLGNGTDRVSLKLDFTNTPLWVRLIADENSDGIHQEKETKNLPSTVAVSENSVYTFFVEVSAPKSAKTGSWAWAALTASSRGDDGPAYMGYNGAKYGGPDRVAMNISVYVE